MLDLLALATPLEPVQFPNGRVFPVRPLDAIGWEMLRTATASGSDGDALATLRRCVPDATDDDFVSLGIEDVQNLLLYATRKVRFVSDAIKNSSGEAAPIVAPTSPPSSPEPAPSIS